MGKMVKKTGDKSNSLRLLLKGTRRIVTVCGAYDGLSALLAKNAGFDAIWASSFCISSSHGVRDTNVLNIDQFIERADEMSRPTDMPVIADCSVNIRNEKDLLSVVQKYHSAGIAAIAFEDTLPPKLNSLMSGYRRLKPLKTFTAQIEAALKITKKEGPLIIARTESLIAGQGQAETLRRVNAYIDCGADVILVHSKSPGLREIQELLSRLKRKTVLAVIPTTFYKVTIAQLSNMGINMVIYANQGLRAAVQSMKEALQTIKRQGTTMHIENRIATMQDIFSIINDRVHI